MSTAETRSIEFRGERAIVSIRDRSVSVYRVEVTDGLVAILGATLAIVDRLPRERVVKFRERALAEIAALSEETPA